MRILFNLLVSFICLILTIQLSFSQGDAPPFVKGQGQASASVAATILVPSSQATKVSSSKTLIETGNTNLLVNPSFEHVTVTTGWTTTSTGTATCALTQASATPMKGEAKYGLFTASGGASGGTCSLKQSPNTDPGINHLVGLSYLANPMGAPGPTTVLYTLVNGVRTTSQDVSNTSAVSLGWLPWYVSEYSTGSNTGVEVLITVATGTTTTILVDQARVEPSVNLSTARTMTNWYASVAQGTLQDSTAEIRYASVNPFTIKGDTSLLTYTDDAGSTRTRFTANQRVYVSASFGSAITTTNASVSIRVNGTTVQTGSQIRTANDNSTVTFNGYLNAGDYLTFDAGSVITTGGSVYASITAISDAFPVFSSQCGAACENTYSAYISSTGVVSGEEVDWINGNCPITSTSTATCTLNFTTAVAMNCWGGFDGGAGESNVQSVSTTTVVVKTFNSAGAAGASAQRLFCRKTGADYIASRTIVGSFKSPDGEHIVDSGNGHGSTNTRIRRYSNIRKSIGDGVDYTYADSSTLGASWTVIKPGVYAISAMDRTTGADDFMGITVNDTIPSTNLSAGPMTYAQGVRSMAFSISTRVIGTSWTGYLNTGDVVRIHTNASMNATDSYSMVTFKKVSF